MQWLRSIACGVLLLAHSAAARIVEFRVLVPEDTPAGTVVYLSGEHESLGNWKPDAVKLERLADGSYSASVDLPEGVWIEYKVTQGSWQTVEKAADGRDRNNRRLYVPKGSTKRILATVEAWSTAAPTTQPLVIGDLRLHEVDSQVLGTKRTIRVWLPQGYDDETERRYPVLYLHDGQNCFDRSTSAFGHEWQIDETLTRLIAEGTIEPLIAVGIDNGGDDRIAEYTYLPSPANSDRGGKGEHYARFLREEVIPFIEATYRTRNDRRARLLGGSSLGGLISLEIARRHPDTFGGVMAMSPSLLWAGSAILNDLEADASGLKNTRIWIDMGTREGDTVESFDRVTGSARRLDAILTRQSIEHKTTIAEGAAHNEQAWAERFPEAAKYLHEQKDKE